MIAFLDRREQRAVVADLGAGRPSKERPAGMVTAMSVGATSLTLLLDPICTLASPRVAPALNSGLLCHALKPHCISLTNSSIRLLKLPSPATTMIRRRPFCAPTR